jgi:hypothetical protein
MILGEIEARLLLSTMLLATSRHCDHEVGSNLLPYCQSINLSFTKGETKQSVAILPMHKSVINKW